MHIDYQTALYIALITRGGGSGSVASIRWPGQMDPHAPGVNRHPHPSFRAVKETLEMTGRRDFFTFLYLPAALLGVTEIALVWWRVHLHCLRDGSPASCGSLREDPRQPGAPP